MFFPVDFWFQPTMPAQTNVFESMICRRYKVDCKIALVQSQVVAVNGWKEHFHRRLVYRGIAELIIGQTE
jgi:hypothetical protein